MDLTHDQSIKLKNFREHYRVLVNNIRQANSELQETTSKRDAINKDLLKKKRELKEVFNTIDEAKQHLDFCRKEADRVSEEADGYKLDALRQLDTAVDTAEEKARSIIDEARKRKVEIVGIEDRTESLKDQVIQLEKEVEDKTNLYQKFEREIEEQKETIKLLQKDYDATLKGFDDSLKKIQKDTDRAHKELVKINNEIEKAEPYLKEAERNLRERETRVKKREEDAAVLVRRIKKWYNKNKPGVEPKL